VFDNQIVRIEVFLKKVNLILEVRTKGSKKNGFSTKIENPFSF